MEVGRGIIKNYTNRKILSGEPQYDITQRLGGKGDNLTLRSPISSNLLNIGVRERGVLVQNRHYQRVIHKQHSHLHIGHLIHSI